MAHLEFFSESRIALNREVRYHPELIERLQEHPANEFEIRVAEIAAYCAVILDGDYTPSDLDKLCDILYWKLVEMRTGIIGVPTK